MSQAKVIAKPKRKPASARALLLWTLFAGLLFGALDLGRPIDNATRAFRAAVNRHKASDNIVIVKVDDASLRRIGNWPWSRSAHARLVDQLTRMGARQIAYDVVFTYQLDRAGDEDFARALAASGRVVLPVGYDSQTRQKLFPLEQFSKHATLADISLYFAFDSNVRSTSFVVPTSRGPIPSMPAKLAGLKYLPPGTFPLDYSVDPATFDSVSAADVIEGKVAPGRLVGKIALIGTTTDVLGDQFSLPGYARMGGVYVHAIGAETLITKGRAFDLGWLPALVLAGLVGWVAVSRRRPLHQNAILVAGFMVILLGPIPLEAGTLYFDASPGFFVIAVILWQLNWARLRNRSTVNDVSQLPNLIALRSDPSATDRPLIVARLHNYAEIVSALPADAERIFVEQVTSRLCVGASGRKLFHGDEGLFAWFAEPNIVIGHHLDALHSLFRSPVKARGHQYDVMISFGVESGSGRAVGNRLGSALVAADEAEAEGLKWKFHDPARLADASWKLSLLSQLDDAIENGQVWVAFQPKLELSSGRIVGVEALARWTHPEKGPISPTEFIGAAEQHDRIERLTDFILDEAVGAVGPAYRAGHDLNVAVNLSARLLIDPALPKRVKECLDRHGLPATQLTLELTETAALAGSGQDIEMLRRLQGLGVHISIDDYGTGLSTLEYLKKVPAAEIKIDQSFIKAIREHRSDRLMVQSTIALAHSLGRIVTAEGVEDRDTLELLTTMGCDIAQGFVIGRPSSLRHIIKQLPAKRGLRAAS